MTKTRDLTVKEKSLRLLGAAMRGDVAEVCSLLEGGADVNILGNHDRAPLHYAVIHNHKDIVEILLEHGARVDEEDYFGLPALHYAFENGSIDTAALLIENGADVANIRVDGASVLHHAVRFGSIDLVNLILYKCNQNINELDKKGLAPLHIACIDGMAPIISALVSNGANVYIKTVPMGHDAITLANRSAKAEAIGAVMVGVHSEESRKVLNIHEKTILDLKSRLITHDDRPRSVTFLLPSESVCISAIPGDDSFHSEPKSSVTSASASAAGQDGHSIAR